MTNLPTYRVQLKCLGEAGLVVLRDAAILLALGGVLDRPDTKQSGYVDRLLKETIDKDSD